MDPTQSTYADAAKKAVRITEDIELDDGFKTVTRTKRGPGRSTATTMDE